MEHPEHAFSTRTIHVGEEPDFSAGSKYEVVPPIYLSTTYAWPEVKSPGVYQYSRSENPTRAALEKRYASLEGTKYALGFASGSAATANVLFTVLSPNDHIIAFDDLYGGTKRLFSQWRDKFGVEITLVDATISQNIESAIKPNTRLVWIETPTNPLIKVCDIAAIAEIAHKHGAILVVDNTFLSPYFQQPAALGADIVLHSVTKYIAGHSDVIGGALMVNDDALYEQLHFNQVSLGSTPSPFDCYLTLRGLKTLPLRMEKHQSNALAIAHYLEKHPKVAKVYYPGLPSHPQYELSKKQSKGFGGMISFEIKGAEADLITLLQSFKLFTLAESLGGVESLIESPTHMTHASMTAEERAEAGIKDTLVRASIGVEELQDLIQDLEQAFQKI